MTHIYIVSSFQETYEHDFFEIERIFTTQSKVDAFMLSQTWEHNPYSPSGWNHPFTATHYVYDEDGNILLEEKLDYSAHAPPKQKEQENTKSCGAYMEKLLQMNTS